MMRPTKLVFIAMIGLAMLEFSIAPSLNAATSTKAAKPSLASAKQAASRAATPAKSASPVKSMHGIAAIYSDKLNGRKTASGQTFSQAHLTAAHRSLPLGTTVRVVNIRNNKTVEVRINDRGPYRGGRMIDLSAAAAEKVGMKKAGIALVKLEIVSEPSVNKS